MTTAQQTTKMSDEALRNAIEIRQHSLKCATESNAKGAAAQHAKRLTVLRAELNRRAA